MASAPGVLITPKLAEWLLSVYGLAIPPTVLQSAQRQPDRTPGAHLAYVEVTSHADGKALATPLLTTCGTNPGDEIEIVATDDIPIPAVNDKCWVSRIGEVDEETDGEYSPPKWVKFSAINCVKKYQLAVNYNPSSGTFPLPVRAKNISDAWVLEYVTVAYNATVAAVKTAIESHSLIDPDTVIVTGALALGGNGSNHTIVMPAGTELGDGGSGVIDASGLVRQGLEDPTVSLSECCS